MSREITQEEAEEAAQKLRDYAYQQDAPESTQDNLLRSAAALGLETRAPIDI